MRKLLLIGFSFILLIVGCDSNVNKVTSHYENGQIEEEQNYKNGKLIETKQY